jgi:hypothetical protein
MAEFDVHGIVLHLSSFPMDPGEFTRILGLDPNSSRPSAPGKLDLDGTWFEEEQPGSWVFSTRTRLGPGPLDEHVSYLAKRLTPGMVESVRELEGKSDRMILVLIEWDEDSAPLVADLYRLISPGHRADLDMLAKLGRLRPHGMRPQRSDPLEDLMR